MRSKSDVDAVLKIFMDGEKNLHEIARVSGVPYPSVQRWVRKHQETGLAPTRAIYKPDIPDGKSLCSGCFGVLSTDNFYVKSDGRLASYCSRCANDKTVLRQQELKAKLVSMFGGACELCYYNKYLGGLQFHHMDPKKKDFHISQARTSSMTTVLPEALKCVLVCANCHFELHHGIHDDWLAKKKADMAKTKEFTLAS